VKQTIIASSNRWTIYPAEKIYPGGKNELFFVGGEDGRSYHLGLFALLLKHFFSDRVIIFLGVYPPPLLPWTSPHTLCQFVLPLYNIIILISRNVFQPASNFEVINAYIDT